MCIFLFMLDDIIFSNLNKNTLKNQNFKKGQKINKFQLPKFHFDQKFYNIFSINDFISQITFSYSYEEMYYTRRKNVFPAKFCHLRHII